MGREVLSSIGLLSDSVPLEYTIVIGKMGDSVEVICGSSEVSYVAPDIVGGI